MSEIALPSRHRTRLVVDEDDNRKFRFEKVQGYT